MSIRNIVLPRLAKWIISLVMKSCQIEISGLKNYLQTAEDNKCILSFWHKYLTIMPFFVSQCTPTLLYSAVVSDSRDGRILTNAVASYPRLDIIRTPHDGRHHSLKKVISILKNEHSVVIITPDGPVGPPLEVKPGVIFAAQKTGAKIIPLSWTASKYWTINSWDKMIIPKPFSKISFVIGEPVCVSEDLQESAKALETSLNDLEKGII